MNLEHGCEHGHNRSFSIRCIQEKELFSIGQTTWRISHLALSCFSNKKLDWSKVLFWTKFTIETRLQGPERVWLALFLHFFQPFFPPIQVKRQQMHEYNRSCVWITVNSRDILDWITPRRFEWWLKGRKGNSKVVFLPTCARERGWQGEMLWFVTKSNQINYSSLVFSIDRIRVSCC